MQNKKWLSMLLALLVSIGLWVYVVTVVNPEGEITLNNIPVTYSGQEVLREDYNLLITDDNVPTGVSLTVYGKRSDLKKLQEDVEELSVRVDVTRIRSAKEYTFAYGVSDITLPSSVANAELTFTDQSPKNITVTIGHLSSKPVEVRVLAQIKTAEGYIQDRVIQDVSEVQIEGPKEIVDQVEYALVTLNRENVDQTINTTLPYTLMDADGNMIDSDEITADIQEVNVTVPIAMYKDVPLDVGIIDGGGAKYADVTVDILPRTVQISGDAAALAGVSSIKLGNVDLGSLKSNNETLQYTIIIPDGCTSLSGEQEASVTVSIKNRSIKQMRISNSQFQYVNVPEGLEAESKTTVLLVSVRAGTGEINQITEENLRVVADFSGVTAEPGTLTLPVTIYVDGFEDAGVFGGEYKIVVELKTVQEQDAE